MKRIQRFFILCMAAILMVSLAACAPAESGKEQDNYGVTVTGTSSIGSCLDVEIEYRTTKPVPEGTPAETTKTLTINGETHTLHFQENKWTWDRYEFVSSDGKINALYWIEGTLAQIDINEVDMTQFANMDQAQLTEWFHNFVSQYMQEDWSTYQESHLTSYEKGGSHKSCKIFKADFAEDELLEERRINYRKKYLGTNTSDNFNCYIDFEWNKITIQFSRHKFDNFTTDIDIEAARKAASDYIQAHMLEGFTFNNVIWANEMLQYEEDNLILYYLAEIHYTDTINGEDGACLYQIVVDIPDV